MSLSKVFTKMSFVVLYYLTLSLLLFIGESSLFVFLVSMIIELVILLIVYSFFALKSNFYANLDRVFYLLFSSSFIVVFYLVLSYLLSSHFVEYKPDFQFEYYKIFEPVFYFKTSIILCFFLLLISYSLNIRTLLDSNKSYQVIEKNIVYHILLVSMIFVTAFALAEAIKLYNIFIMSVILTVFKVIAEVVLNNKMKVWFAK